MGKTFRFDPDSPNGEGRDGHSYKAMKHDYKRDRLAASRNRRRVANMALKGDDIADAILPLPRRSSGRLSH